MLVDLLNSNFNFSTLGGRSYSLYLINLLLFKIRMTHECWGAEDENMLTANSVLAPKQVANNFNAYGSLRIPAVSNATVAGDGDAYIF
jgi:hypothetical protein